LVDDIPEKHSERNFINLPERVILLELLGLTRRVWKNIYKTVLFKVIYRGRFLMKSARLD
jgi:hypothetical protein